MTDPKKQSKVEWLEDYEGKPKAKKLSPVHVEQQPPDWKPRIVIPEDSPVLIPVSEYFARCTALRYEPYRGGMKIYLTFVIEQGQFVGTKLERFYNLEKIISSEGGECFMPPRLGDLLRDMREFFEGRIPKWADENNFIDSLFKVQVGTVTRNHASKALGKSQYSKVSCLLELIEE